MLCWKVVYTMEDIYLNKRNEGCWGKVPKQAKKGLLRDDIGPKVWNWPESDESMLISKGRVLPPWWIAGAKALKWEHSWPYTTKNREARKRQPRWRALEKFRDVMGGRREGPGRVGPKALSSLTLTLREMGSQIHGN